MEVAFDELAELQRKEPHEGLAEQAGRVFACTAVAPLSFRSVVVWERDGGGARQYGTPEAPLVELRPPNETFTVRFSEQDPLLRFDRLFSTAERIRNLVAFGVGQAVPMAVQLAGRGLLHPVIFNADPPTNVPRPATEGDSEAIEEWYNSFRDGYELARRALSQFPPNAPEGRALSLVGEALWSADVEERFFYCWRALEVIGNLRLNEAHRRLVAGERSASEPYLDAAAQALLSGQTARIDAAARVKIAVSGQFPQFTLARIDDFYSWRNAIAHGDVTQEQHLDLLKAGPEILGLACDSARALVRIEAGGPS